MSPPLHANWPSTGARLGAYELLAPLGMGGMGAVFLARKAGLDEVDRYAVKVLLPQFASDPQFVKMFLHEARIASKLFHPNICRVIDYGVEGVSHYLSMEFLHGRDLGTLLRATAESAEDDDMRRRVMLRVLFDVAAGLEHAHGAEAASGQRLNIVHRDVCAQNIFVNDTGVSKLVDFGIALHADRTMVTEAGEMRGHLAYIAPEVVAGMRADARSDTWGLGVVAWECLSGRRLFRRESCSATLDAVLHARVPSLEFASAEATQRVDQIFERALARDPDARYPTPTALVHAIANGLGVDPAEAVDVGSFAARVAPAPEVRESDPHGLPEGDRERSDAALLTVADSSGAGSASALRLRSVALGGALAGAAFLAVGLAVARPDEGPDRVPPEDPEHSMAAEPAPRLEPVADSVPEEVPAVATPRARDRSAGMRAVTASGVLVVPPSAHWAEVWVDDARVGYSPLSRSLSAGRHRVSLRRNGEVLLDQRVDIEGDGRAVVRVPTDR